MNPPNPNMKAIESWPSKSLGFEIITFVNLVGMVYEESYDLCWKNKDQEEVGEEPPR